MSGDPRVAVIGAGPIGLEAALYAAAAGLEVDVYEGGPVGAHLKRWGHVRLFTPWALNTSSLGRRRLLAEHIWSQGPDAAACPTGAEFVSGYLKPLASLPELRGRVHTGHRVLAVGRGDLIKSDGVTGTPDRKGVSFNLLIQGPEGESTETAGIVIDATGVFGQPNAAGRGGIPAPGERDLGDDLTTGLPDVLGVDRDRFANRRILVVGGGFSAATTITALAEVPGVAVTWVTRTGAPPLSEIRDDPLSERVSLTRRANALVAEEPSWLRHIGGSSIRAFTRAPSGVTVSVVGPGGTERVEVDQIVSQTGFRPDNSIYRELQFHECYASEGPMKLSAALLGNAGGDCMTQESMGADTLRNPEPGFFVIGNKSYGRGPNFLLRIGRDQVREVFTLITGNPELDLYANEEARVS